jgi:predicted Zn-dependent protease
VAAAPDHVAGKVLLTELLIRENRLAEAETLLADIKHTAPQEPAVLALEGELALRQGRTEDAIRAYEALMAKTPQGRWTVGLSAAQWRAGLQADANATLERWLAEHPDDAGVRYGLANNYLLLGERDKAKSELAAILARIPEHALALNNLAWLLRDEDPERALEYAQRAVKAAPEAPAILDTLGVLLVAQGQTEQGLTVLRQAAQIPGGPPELRYHLAQALVRAGKSAEAREILTGLLGDSAGFAERPGAEALLRDLGGAVPAARH